MQRSRRAKAPFQASAFPDPLAVEERQLASALTACGVHALDPRGVPISAAAATAANPATPDGPGLAAAFRPVTPAARLLSRLLAATAQASRDRLFADMAEKDQARMRSASGPQAGMALVAPLVEETVHFADRPFAAVLRLRLGMALFPPTANRTCRNVTAAGKGCNAQLTSDGHHALVCPTGPLRNRRHNNICDHVADIISKIGGLARRECYVASFSRGRDAILDVCATGVQEVPDLIMDITVRHPLSHPSLHQAASVDAVTAIRAEADKLARYPSTGGRIVVPFAFEVWGRLGPAGERLLRTLGAAAKRVAMHAGRTPGRDVAKWRATLDAALQRSNADQLHAAMYSLPGRPARLPRISDRTAIEVGPPPPR